VLADQPTAVLHGQGTLMDLSEQGEIIPTGLFRYLAPRGGDVVLVIVQAPPGVDQCQLPGGSPSYRSRRTRLPGSSTTTRAARRSGNPAMAGTAGSAGCAGSGRFMLLILRCATGIRRARRVFPWTGEGYPALLTTSWNWPGAVARGGGPGGWFRELAAEVLQQPQPGRRTLCPVSFTPRRGHDLGTPVILGRVHGVILGRSVRMCPGDHAGSGDEVLAALRRELAESQAASAQAAAELGRARGELAERGSGSRSLRPG
jgi:hypothetical protein